MLWCHWLPFLQSQSNRSVCSQREIKWIYSDWVQCTWVFVCLCVRETDLGSICATRASVFCLSTSSSSVLSRIKSSRLVEYCSSMRSMESMMLVFLPLLIVLNCGSRKIHVNLSETIVSIIYTHLCKRLFVIAPVWRSLRTRVSALDLHSMPASWSEWPPVEPRPLIQRVGKEEEDCVPYLWSLHTR